MGSGEGALFVRPDADGFREFVRANKPHSPVDKRMSEREAVRRFVRPGDYVATDLYGMVRAPMSLAREVVRQGPGDLSIAGQGGMDIDLLVASGLVRRIDNVYIGHEVFGLSGAFRRLAAAGKVEVTEWTNAALAWRFKAAAMGIPYIPSRTMLGTDTFRRSAAVLGRCPFSGKMLCLLPALAPDVGIIHVHRCDRFGNAQIDGTYGLGFELSRASRRLILSTERVVPGSAIRKVPERTVIPHYLVDAVVVARYGSHPGEMCYEYAMDRPRVDEYLEATRTEEGTRAYLEKYVRGPRSHEEYLELVGGRRHLRRLERACRGR
ncbi:MAG: CoA transferase subunit A [Euryarchaeota archaeon]|nr:CoA transferase subunit A [Euryarchaeota archaeon]